jgi:catalase (peroxidase I)
MFGPGPEDVAMLRHAGAAAGISCNHLVSFASSQASCFRIIELLLKVGISLATLAINPTPNWEIVCSRAAIQTYGAAAKENNDGKGQNLSAAHFQISNRSSLARGKAPGKFRQRICIQGTILRQVLSGSSR